MDIRKEQNGSELFITVEGDLNTFTSPVLEDELKGALKDITRLVFDFSNLNYISSSGLRVLFGAQQVLDGTGEVIVRNPNPDVLEILEFTGCTSILTVEQ